MLNQLRSIIVNFFDPLKAFRIRYVPLLSVYLANGFINFSLIAENFWYKNSLSLSATDIISISIWINLPWSMKIILGQMIDSIKLFGSQRRIYIFIAAFIMLIGNFFIIAVANNFTEITSLASTYNLIILGGFLINLGIVFQDLIADTLCYEVTIKQDSKGRDLEPEEIKKEVGKIQILARIIDITAGFLAVLVSGFLAANFSFAIISFLTPIIAIISIVGSIFVKTEPKIAPEQINWKILAGGILYVFFIFLTSLTKYKYSQELIFIVGIIVVVASIYNICKDLEDTRKKQIFAMLVLIFAYRASPTFGPGVDWWQIDELKFTPEFFALLQQIGMVLGFLGVWFFGKKIIAKNFAVVILVINTIHVLLQLPMIAMSFGFHEWTMKNFGFGAKVIALFDNTMEGPFQRLGFLILCSAATYFAPKKNLVSWFALVMSLMSLVLVSGSRIIKKYLSIIYPIERGNYENVSSLMIATTTINFLLPTIFCLLFLKTFAKKLEVR